jgi:ketosteroid isomerase-like protein
MSQQSVGAISAATFEEAVERLRAATDGFVNGDCTRWKALCSHRSDASVAGRAGGFDVGWPQVEQRYDWIAEQYQAGELSYETISSFASGALGYSLELVRGTVVLKGKAAAEPIELRVTHIFRHEDDGWRLVHRHADQAMMRRPLVELSRD